MLHHVYADQPTYKVAVLVKQSAFQLTAIENAYINPLEHQGIAREDIIVVGLEYDKNNKAPVSWIKMFLEDLLPNLEDVKTQYIYCADANYFKVLTKKTKADAHLGYKLNCAIEGFEHFYTVLGVNHTALLYNPANEPKLELSLKTLVDIIQGTYSDLGGDIIHGCNYPTSPDAIAHALAGLHDHPRLTADLETGSLDFEKAGIGTVTFCWDAHNGIAFPCDYRPFKKPDAEGNHGELKANKEVRALLKQFLKEYKGELIWHNSPYDLKIIIFELWMENLLDTAGLLEGLDVVTRNFHDTKIIAYLALNTVGTAKGYLGLKSLAHEFAGNWAVDVKDIRKQPLSKLLEYNLLDGLSTYYVFDKYYPKMVEDNQLALYNEMMLPSQKTLIQVELSGMPLNPEKVAYARKQLEKTVRRQVKVLKRDPMVKACEAEIQDRRWEKDFQDRKSKAKNPDKIMYKDRSKFNDERYNPNSPKQTQVLLYEFLDLPVIDTTKTKQPAVGAKTLKKLTNHTEDPAVIAVLKALQEFSLADKILTTFIPVFENAIDKGTSGILWIHGNFNLGGTVSGRLSSSDPNLQNLPSGSAYGKLIKDCFQAPKGWLFAGADFNSLEDYISALTTRDPNKLKVYTDGYDGHTLRAFSYWPEKFPFNNLTPELSFAVKKDPLLDTIRSASKGPTFALTYQGTFHALMNQCGFSKQEAQHIENNFKELYKVSIQWVQDKLKVASKTGYVEVAFGLRVRTPLLAATLRGRKSTPYEAEAEARTAGNALGQSYGLLNNRAANDFMQKVWVSPHRLKIKPIGLIHDAIYLLMEDDIAVVEWVNRELIKSMSWQDLPELAHDTVKLGAALDIFYPSWATALELPNNATQKDILNLTTKHYNSINA